MRHIYTENSHLKTKVRLRTAAVLEIGKPKIHVLDAFAGQGLVWKAVQRELPEVEITTLGIEKKKYLAPDVIMGDNRKVMKGLDLTIFDLIDLDAFGCPWEQLAICAERAPEVPVAITHISITLGPVPQGLLELNGIPDEWCKIKEVPHALFGRWRWWWWEQYCARLGYNRSDYELHLDKSAVKRYEVVWREPVLDHP
ncbi:MAG: hypothetical protein EBZ91_08330 [Gammaproteobacteria bacterium]|nr:hypothetical protein [Gammaproteobacteria bacterium]